MKFLGDLDTSDLILLDIKHSRLKTEEGRSEDYAMVLLKNVRTGEKFVYNIKDPEIELHFAKPEERNFDYNLTAIERDRTFIKKVKARSVINEIVKEAGGEWKQYYDRCREQGNYKAFKNIHHYPYVFGSDLDVADYYRCMWTIHYHNPNTQVKLTKMFMDIEVDGIDTRGVPLDGVAPINAVSITDTESKTCYAFLLRNACRENPQIAEFEEHIDEFYEKCHEEFDKEFPGFQYKVFMFDNEVQLLTGLFTLIKKLDRDFCAIWNMGYDIPYIIARCNVLGIDPVELITDRDFAVRDLYYWNDSRAGMPVEKKDYFNSSTRTIYTDAMLNYGKIRKGGSVIRSLKLNYVSTLELDEQKLDYSKEANIKTMPYVNYMMFVLYNMKDTLLMHNIENRTDDIDNLFSRAIANGSSYKEVFSQTKFLRNRFFVECYKDGFISGNNANMDYAAAYGASEDDGVGYDGAVVGDPELNCHVGVNVFGKRSKYVFKYVVDMDFSSMYPWSIISFNISAHTMIGKLFINKEYYKGEIEEGDADNPDLKFEPGKQFVEDLLAQDYIKLGQAWFNLPSVTDMLADLEEKKPKRLRVSIGNEGFDVLAKPVKVTCNY